MHHTPTVAPTPPVTIWDQIQEALRREMAEEDFRRWFGATAYANDSGDQITVWVPTESIRRHIVSHYEDAILRALRALDRSNTHVRLVVSGMDEDEDDDDQ
jgi:chromosomal replication initiation ATPase DnaA